MFGSQAGVPCNMCVITDLAIHSRRFNDDALRVIRACPAHELMGFFSVNEWPHMSGHSRNRPQKDVYTA